MSDTYGFLLLSLKAKVQYCHRYLLSKCNHCRQHWTHFGIYYITLGETSFNKWEKKAAKARHLEKIRAPKEKGTKTPLKMLVAMRKKNAFRSERKDQRDRDSGLTVPPPIPSFHITTYIFIHIYLYTRALLINVDIGLFDVILIFWSMMITCICHLYLYINTT